MKNIIIRTLILIFSLATIHAAELTVFNQTETDKLVTVWYYDELKKQIKHKGPFQISANSKRPFSSSGANRFLKTRWQESETIAEEQFTQETYYQALTPSNTVMLNGVIVLYVNDSYGINFDKTIATSEITLKQADTCQGTTCFKDPHAPSRPINRPVNPNTPSQPNKNALESPEGRYFITKDFTALAKEIVQNKIYGDAIAEKLTLLILARYSNTQNESPIALLKNVLAQRINSYNSNTVTDADVAQTRDAIKGFINAFCITLKAEYNNRELFFTDNQKAAPLIARYLQ